MSKNDNKIKVYPDIEPVEDKLYRLAEAVTSLIPAGQVTLHSLITPPIQKRMEEWMAETEAQLNQLESEGVLDYEKLLERPEFSSLVLRAVNAAAVSSQTEKLDALRNFIVNIALDPNLEEDELYIILSIIDNFTPSHIKVLHFYHSPQEYNLPNFREGVLTRSKEQGEELSSVFGSDNPEYWQNIFYQLSDRHLVTNIVNNLGEGAQTIAVQGSITEIGEKVLQFISRLE